MLGILKVILEFILLLLLLLLIYFCFWDNLCFGENENTTWWDLIYFITRNCFSSKVTIQHFQIFWLMYMHLFLFWGSFIILTFQWYIFVTNWSIVTQFFQQSNETCLAYTLVAICNLLSETGISSTTGILGSSLSPLTSIGISLSVQQQLFVLLRGSLKRAENLKLKRLVASSHLAMARFDLTVSNRTTVFNTGFLIFIYFYSLHCIFFIVFPPL